MRRKIQFSFQNFVSDATITASSEAASYPATNIAFPERPFMPWRSGATGAQSVVIDFGSAQTLGVVVLARTNFVTATLAGNASDSWGSPSFSQAITITRNPLTGRYQYAALLTGFTFQFMRISIASQTPTDGAAYYLLGGVWAGAATAPPKNFLYQVEYRTIEPRVDLQPDHGGWRQRVHLGEPVARMSATRVARTTFPTPFVDDHLRLWTDLDRQMREADKFALFLNNLDSSQGYVVRRTSDMTWRQGRHRRSDSSLDLEEAVQ